MVDSVVGPLSGGDMDFALVEETRPPMYTAMKYWGKKPHNIWGRYVARYAPAGGVCLDPFCGSAMSAFEAFRAGKKAVAFDINPMSAFFIEVFGAPFERTRFKREVARIVGAVERESVYRELFAAECHVCGGDAVLHNAKWDGGVPYEVGIECAQCAALRGKRAGRHLRTPSAADERRAAAAVEMEAWVPPDEFHASPSFPHAFVTKIGGRRFADLWTRRNLWVIARIFAEIRAVGDVGLKKQLLFGFVQTIHLCTKMCVPRRAAAKRLFFGGL